MGNETSVHNGTADFYVMTFNDGDLVNMVIIYGQFG